MANRASGRSTTTPEARCSERPALRAWALQRETMKDRVERDSRATRAAAPVKKLSTKWKENCYAQAKLDGDTVRVCGGPGIGRAKRRAGESGNRRKGE